MKKILILLCCFISSCQMSKQYSLPYITVFMSGQTGEVLPSYIILKSQPKIFEMYMPGIWGNTIGDWEYSRDTLYLFPKYEYYNVLGENKMDKISLNDTTVVVIPHQYLVKKDKLVDITDYSIVDSFFFKKDNHGEVYVRIR